MKKFLLNAALSAVFVIGLLSTSYADFDKPLAPMSGIYTVNPAAAVSGTNFQTMLQVTNSLNTNGVSGAVTIQVYNGNYTASSGVVSNVAGVSSTNTVTYTSFSNDSIQAKITTLSFQNTSFIIIKKIWVDNLYYSGTTSDCIVQNSSLRYIGWTAANNLTVMNNNINGGLQIGTMNNGPLISNIIVKNNIIRNGANDGNASPYLTQYFRVTKPVFEGNSFTDFNFNHRAWSGFYYYPYKGTFLFVGCSDSALFLKNRFLRCSSTRLICDENEYQQTQKLSHVTIQNSFISCTGNMNLTLNDVSGNGIPVGLSYFFNNFENSGAAGTQGFQLSNFLHFRNNIFSSKTEAAAASGSPSDYSSASDYNNFYSAGPAIITGYATLAQWQAATGADANSASVNPKYYDSVNLHVRHPRLLATGVPVPAANPVLTDIDNDNRNQLNPCIGADEFQAPSADIIALQYTSPKKDFTSSTPLPLKLKVFNNGSAQLNQFNVRWSINGTEQPPYVWSGALNYDSTADITFGSYSFPIAKYTALKIWTDLPNGVPDMVAANDTVRVDSIMPYAKGDLTLGGAVPDFVSFSKAAEILTYGGVEAPVNVMIRNGKYTEQPVMKYVRGASATNTITYRGANNSAAVDTLTFSSIGSGTVAYPTMRLDSAAFMTFKHITFQSQSGWSREVEFSRKSRFITFDSCVFTSVSTNSNYPHIEGETINSLIPLDSNAVFTNNSFKNGSYGGIVLALKNGLIKGNRFENLNGGSSNNGAVHITGSFTGTNKLVIDSNYFNNPLICTFASGGICYISGYNGIAGINVAVSGAENDITISRNIINAINRNAISVSSSGTAAKPVRIFNNFVSIRSSGIAINSSGAWAEITHNSLADSINGPSNLVELRAANILFKNNYLSKGVFNTTTTNTAACLFVNTTALSTLISSNNAYAINDSARTILNNNTAQTLGQWRAATGKDVASRFTQPAFIHPYNNLHIDKNKGGAVDLAKRGTTVSYVTTDIDDEARNLTAPTIGADEFMLNPIDAGVMYISAPSGVFPLGANNVTVAIRNYGENTLSGATINWSVNGAAQTPYSYGGSLASGDSAVNILLGSFDFSTPQRYDIKAWTSNDPNAVNDTASKIVYPALCGNYTIGGTTPDFTTPKTAMNYLALAGVTCAVIFDIRDGNYNESDTLNLIKGASVANTITFRGQSLDSSKVSIFQTDFSGGNSTAVLRIIDAQHVKFIHLAVKRTPEAGVNHFYFNTIVASGDCSGLSFNNCELTSSGSGTIYGATHAVAENINFSNNRFVGGSAAVSISGQGNNNVKGISISNNKFLQPIGNTNATYSVNIVATGAVKVVKNYFDSCVLSYRVGGISMNGVRGKVDVIGNTIIKRKGINGINLESVGGGPTTDSAAVIANNFITIDSTVSGTYGIYSSSTARNLKIVYNNVLSNCTNTNSAALYFRNSFSTGTLKDTIANNNLVSAVAGYALNFSQNTTGDVQLSNNNFFVSGAAKIASYQNTDYTTVASLPTASNTTNLNQVSKNPLYLSAHNLHVGELSLRTDGKPLPYITDDIDGDVRGTVSTTIGADEIVINNLDIGISAIINPAKPFAAGPQTIRAEIKNYGAATVTTAAVNWSLNGVMQAPVTFNGSIAFNQAGTVDLATVNFLIDSGYVIRCWTAQPNGSADAVAANDTLYVENIYAALSGTYTLGGTAPDFKRFSRSHTNLKFGGLLGNVLFNVREGIYPDNLQIDSLPFQNNYVVTWQGETADSTKARLRWTGTTGDNVQCVVGFNNAKNIMLKNLTIEGKLPAVGASLTQLIQFTNKNKNIIIAGNILRDSSYNNTGNTSGIGFISNRDQAGSSSSVFESSKDTGIVIRNNNFIQTNFSTATVMQFGGRYTVSFGNVITYASYLNNILIEGNRMRTLAPGKPAVIITAADSTRIIGNALMGTVAFDGKDLLVFDRNDVYHENYNAVAVTVAAGARAAGKPAIISNNLIQSKRAGLFNTAPVPNTALFVNGDRVNILHNTLVTTDTGSVSGYSSYAQFKLSGNLDTVKNNIFYNVNGGTLLDYGTSATFATNLTSNNNDYIYGRNFSFRSANLAAHRTLMGQDAQSVEDVKPYFRGPRDLHATNILLKTAPALIPANAFTITDFDGQLRGATVSYGADEFSQPANDMIVLKASPEKIFPQGLNDVKITVYNNGTNPITSFNATSAITNFPDTYTPTPAGNTSFNFSGNIAPGATQEITIGQLNVPMYRNIFKVNVNSLNGGIDEVRYNDSLQNDNLYAGFAGSYSFRSFDVPGNATFRAFQDAEMQLELGGVYSSSELNLIPGTHTGYLYIDSIPGRGALSPLVIKSQNGDTATTRMITDAGNSTLLTIFRSNYVTVRDLYFGPSAGSGITSIYQLQLGWNSTNIKIENCRILNSTASLTQATNTGTTAILMSGNFTGQNKYGDSNYVFRNNHITGGTRGIATGGSPNPNIASANIVISNNTLVNQYETGIEQLMLKNSRIDSNAITTNSVLETYKAINLNSPYGKATLTRNKIFLPKDGFGIWHEDQNFGMYTNLDSIAIHNNMITIGETKASGGIRSSLTSYGQKKIGVIYNSVNNRSTHASSYALNMASTQSANMRHDVLNNIFFCKSAGIPVIVTRYTESVYNHHHNNITTAGTVYGRVNNVNYNSLSALSASGIDYLSVSGDPLFISDTDLHVDGSVNNNTGTLDANAFTAVDYDNETRNANTPDIGADEFKLPNFGAVQLESPLSSCSHTSAEIVKAWIKNFGTAPRADVPVAYRINNGAVVRDTVRAVINPGDSVLFSFIQTANLAAPQNYYFDVWTAYRGDSLPANDTLRQVLVATTPSNNVLPYYTGFEGTNAGWYTGGQNSSFKWGVVFSGVVDSAANGLNAWKSNLTGPHNNNELSYLYSPCFDLTTVTADPTLNFNLAYQLENNIDKVWVEWSGDAGGTWAKLGVQGEGLAWYNNAGNYWTGLDKLWHNAKHTLPISGLGDRSAVRIRFVMQTSSSIVQDGIAIDDISIYTGANPPVSNGTYLNRTAVSTGTATFIPVNDPSGNRLMEINDNGQNLGTVTVSVNQNSGGAPTTFGGSTYMGRSWVINVQNTPTAPVRVRLFFTQAEVNAWRALDPSIDLMRNVAVYKFSGATEDFNLGNNTGGTGVTIMPAQLVKVPYLDGYFLEFSVSSFSEFWLTKGPGGVVQVNFVKVNAALQKNDALVTWQVSNQVNVSHYEVEHGTDGLQFRAVGRVDFHAADNYSFMHRNIADGRNYYRIKQVDINGRYKYSTVVTVEKKTMAEPIVYPALFSSVITIDNPLPEAATFTVYSADGKMLKQVRLIKGKNTIDLSGLSSRATYVYRINTAAEAIASGKLVKQ